MEGMGEITMVLFCAGVSCDEGWGGLYRGAARDIFIKKKENSNSKRKWKWKCHHLIPFLQVRSCSLGYLA